MNNPMAPQGVDGRGVSRLAELEPLFTAQQVGEYLHIDASTVRRIFLDRAGVLKLGRAEAGDGKRQYCSIRIPLSVMRAFIRERVR